MCHGFKGHSHDSADAQQWCDILDALLHEFENRSHHSSQISFIFCDLCTIEAPEQTLRLEEQRD